MFKIEKVDNFPEIARAGRRSEELEAIVNALKTSAETGDRFSIGGIVKGNAYNSMQQRIRAQAKKMGMKVLIRFDAENEVLYFKADPMNQETPAIEIKAKRSVKSSDVKGVKTVAKETEAAS